MMEEMEVLLQHWGDKCRACGSAGGLSSPMGSIMQWGGCAPRGTPGSRIPGAGAGPDGLALEVDAALHDIERQGKQGANFRRLAVLRYLSDPVPTVREQMRLLAITEGAERTYYDRVHRLHLRLLQALMTRAKARGHVTVRPGGLPQTCAKVASTLRRTG